MTITLRSHMGVEGPVVAMWDAACGKCHPCHQGLPGRCFAPLPAGTDVLRWHERAVAEVIDDDALCSIADAVWVVGLLIEWRELSPVVTFVGDAHSHDAVAAAIQALSSPFDRRADVVIALDGDLAAASKQVRRGGAIGTVCYPTKLPSYTAIVQRELDVLVPSDLLEAFALADFEAIVKAVRQSVGRSHAT
jgi:hypothetical protein